MNKVPNLRFSSFNDGWKKIKLGDKCTFYSGGTPLTTNKKYYDGNIPFIRSAEISSTSTELNISEDGLNNSSAKMVKKGDLLYALYGATSGEVSISKIDGAINQAILCIQSDQLNLSFLEKILRKNKDNIINTYLQGGQGNLSSKIVQDLRYYFPSLEEQEKIASFFSLIDKKIELQTEKVEELKNYKKGIMQKIFSQQLRFKDENGNEYPEWARKHLSQFVQRVTRKNKGLISTLPLTISAQYGLVDQESFFNKTVASNNLEGYYLLENGEFAYNKSYSNGYPWGTIKRLDKYKCGVLSSLYICFNPNIDINSDYLVHYFESTKWHKEIAMIAVEGARNHGLLNISISDFFDTLHYIPSREEQDKIAVCLSAIDKKIYKEQEKLDALVDYKKGLLQQMFV